MAEKKKNKPAATTRMSTKKQAGFSLATSPRFKTIAKKVDDGELTTAEALDILVPKELGSKERAKARTKLAQALGAQNANRFLAETDQEMREKRAYKKTQTRKPSFNKGGYANCGASMKATQQSTANMAYGGMARKK